MATHVTSTQIKNLILAELPTILRTDMEIRHYILDITRERYADRDQTEHRIERILDELKRDRERQEEMWKTQEKKWEVNQKVIEEMLASLKAIQKKHESSIGALGARWGLNAESAFRDGLKAILEESFHVTVERYEDFDYDGKVFGRPDQIELDLIIYNSTLILCEIKSSISKSQMYTFWRKRQFYEEKHQCQAQRAIVISPMVEESAKKVAQELKIEVYGYADEVPVTR